MGSFLTHCCEDVTYVRNVYRHNRSARIQNVFQSRLMRAHNNTSCCAKSIYGLRTERLWEGSHFVVQGCHTPLVTLLRRDPHTEGLKMQFGPETGNIWQVLFRCGNGR